MPRYAALGIRIEGHGDESAEGTGLVREKELVTFELDHAAGKHRLKQVKFVSACSRPAKGDEITFEIAHDLFD